jgi:hypothetical protein
MTSAIGHTIGMGRRRSAVAVPFVVLVLVGLVSVGRVHGGPMPAQVSNRGGTGAQRVPLSPGRWDGSLGHLGDEDDANRVPPSDQGRSPLPQGSTGNFAGVRDKERKAETYRSAQWEPVQDAVTGGVGKAWPDYLAPPAYKIAVDQDGIYQLTYADLEAAGLPVVDPGIEPHTFRLFNMGTEVAITVEEGGDGGFEPGDAIVFYGQGLDTKYTDTNVYWLTYGQGPGLRMAARDVAPSGTAPIPTSFATTLHLEENRLRDPKVLMGPDDDNWYWKRVMAIGSDFAITQTATFTLTHLSTEPFSATLRTNLHGLTYLEDVNPDHHTQIFLNGHLVDDIWWDGFADIVTMTTISSLYLREGSNVLSVMLPHDTGADNDAFYTNWFDVAYRRMYIAEDDSLVFGQDEAGAWEYEICGFADADIELFDVSDPARATRLVSPTVLAANGSYTLTFEDAISDTVAYRAQTRAQRLSPAGIALDAPSDLMDPENGADYVIIIHAHLTVEGDGDRDDVYDLAAYRSGQGLRTMIVDVEDVYDTFSYGIFDPEALHAFLEHAHSNWAPVSPRYVLLVGNGHYDFREYTTSEPNYIPPYLVYVSEHLGEVAADNRYATIADGDVLPDLAIGRLPVSSVSELATVIDKILSYEQDPPAGDWARRALFVADNQPDMEKQAGNFWDLSDEIASGYLPPAYAAERIYYDKFADEPVHGHPSPPRPEPPYYESVEDARTAIVAGINNGALLLNYYGHGWVNGWTEERVFHLDDVDALHNKERLAMFLSMTCQTSNFSVPEVPSLDGSLLRAAGGGAIATWGCTAEGQSAAHRYLDQGFLSAVLRDGVARIGNAALQGKLHLYQSTTDYRDLIDTYTLFGDPALVLRTLNQAVYLPLVVR